MIIPTPNQTPKKRKMSNSMIRDEDGALNVVPIVSYGHGGHAKLKKKPKVKVSKHFKAALDKVNESKKYHGSKTDINFAALNSTANNLQSVDSFTELVTSYSKWDFLPEYFVDAVSCLFGNKAATVGGYIATAAGNIGTGVTPETSTYGSALKFKVIDSFTRYHYKNNTPRIMTLELYECAPKRCSYLSTSPTTLGGVATAGAQDALISPASYWTACLSDEQSVGINISSAASNMWGLSPLSCPAFKKAFNVTKTVVVLEPGSSYDHFLQGPNDFDFNYAEMFSATVLQNIQKFSRYLLPIIKVDLAGATAGVAPFGRLFHTNSLTTGNIFGYQRTMHCKVEMPEMTGFAYPGTTTGYQALGYRRDPYIINNWPQATSTASGVRDMTQQTNVQGVDI